MVQLIYVPHAPQCGVMCGAKCGVHDSICFDLVENLIFLENFTTLLFLVYFFIDGVKGQNKK